MPIDYIKATCYDQEHITRLYEYALVQNLTLGKPQSSHYVCYLKSYRGVRLEFRKLFSQGKQLQQFHHVEVCFTPHYIYNGGLHNGNDFNVADAISIVQSVFDDLGVIGDDLALFNVCNIEFGVNVQPNADVGHIIDSLLYTGRTPFKRYMYDTSKISEATSYKLIKAYDKGVQFLKHPEYDIPLNTFRFEVRTKKARKINELNIYTVADLLRFEVYNSMLQAILTEWDKVLIIPSELNRPECDRKFWDDQINAAIGPRRSYFSLQKQKFYRSLSCEQNLHHQIKCKIIDKIIQLSICAQIPSLL